MQTNMAIFWGKTPFLKLLIPLVVGILWQWYLPISLFMGLCMAGLMILGLGLFSRLDGYARFRFSWIQGAMCGMLLCMLGAGLVWVRDPVHASNYFENRYQSGDGILGRILDRPVEKQKTYRATMELHQLIRANRFISVSGRIMVYFKKDSGVANLQPSDYLLFKKPPKSIQIAQNPGGLNFGRYLRFKGITQQVYLESCNFKKIDSTSGFVFNHLFSKIRTQLRTILKKYIPGSREAALAQALSVGYREDLDQNLLQAYRDAGVMHIIAISGMHIGFVFLLFHSLTGFLRRWTGLRWWYLMWMLGILWGFCLLTGATPSVVRATVMFSFFLVGQMVARKPSIFNTLAAAAFLLLCFNPLWLWDAGFQLSFAAVTSIVTFYKPIYQQLVLQNPLLNRVWQLVALNISAQILTLPISVYYFHQIPIYFLIANLLVIPAAALILMGSVWLLLLAPVTSIAVLLGNALQGIIWWLNGYVHILGSWPFSTWGGLYVSGWQVAMLFIWVAGMAAWLWGKQKLGLGWASVGIIIFLVIRSFSFYEAGHQRRIIVYNTPNYPAVDFIYGRQHFLWASPSLLQDPDQERYVFRPASIFFRLFPSRPLEQLHILENRWVFGSRVIWHIRNYTDLPGEPEQADLVILSAPARVSMVAIQDRLHPQELVLDGSIPIYKTAEWQSVAAALGIPCYSVVEKGAFVMNLGSLTFAAH